MTPEMIMMWIGSLIILWIISRAIGYRKGFLEGLKYNKDEWIKDKLN